MVSSQEIKKALQAKHLGVDAEDPFVDRYNDFFKSMETPFKPIENGFIFDFGPMDPEKLSQYIDYLFLMQSYHFNRSKNTYFRYQTSYSVPQILLPKYEFKLDLTSEVGKTYLEVLAVFNGPLISFYKLLYGKNYQESALNQLVNQIKLIKVSIHRYLICNKCGAYYELQNNEFPEDFDQTCKCGGELEYIPNSLEIKDNPPKMLNENLKGYWEALVIVTFILGLIFMAFNTAQAMLIGSMIFLITFTLLLIYYGEFIN